MNKCFNDTYNHDAFFLPERPLSPHQARVLHVFGTGHRVESPFLPNTTDSERKGSCPARLTGARVRHDEKPACPRLTSGTGDNRVFSSEYSSEYLAS